MNNLDFFASLVQSLAWPVVVGALLIIGRGQVAKVAAALIARIPEIASLKAGSGEINFDARAAEVFQQAAITIHSSEPSVSDSSDASSRREPVIDGVDADHLFGGIGWGVVEKLLDAEPRAAVLLSWIAVEDALNKRFAAMFPGDADRRVPVRQKAERVLRFDEDGSATLDFLLDLQSMRNDVLHNAGTTFSRAAADDYVGAADIVIRRLTPTVDHARS